jgi:hypothetical protein
VEPLAASYDADSLVYASTPALFGGVSLAALVGGNIPEQATVTLTPQPSGTPLTLLPKRRGAYVLAVSEQLAQVWRLEIAMPTGNSPRPNIGELWLGLPVDLDRSPRMDGLGYTEGDPSQVRVRAARNRVEVLSDDGDPAAALKLQFLVPEDDYVRVRDGLMRLTRFGKEPALLIPGDDFEADRFYHGRVGEEIAYGRITAADLEEPWRSFTLAFDEDPLAAP